MEIYERSKSLPHAIEWVFAWFERPAAFYRQIPPRERIETLEHFGSIRDGDRAKLRMRVGPLSIHLAIQHEEFRPPSEFGNRQTAGPHRSLRHRHLFRATGESSCEMTDRVYCEPNRIVALAGRAGLRNKVERSLDFCQERVLRDLDRHAFAPAQPLRVLITGASGMIGSTLTVFLESGGHEVVRLVRRPPASDSEVAWDPTSGNIDTAALEGFDAVIHLAGENIAAGRWTKARRRSIRESRVASTELLCSALQRVKQPPSVLLIASAVGFYGETEEPVDESAPVGEGFLAEVTAAWEKAAEPARVAGIRVVHARLGVVLSPLSGLLGRLLPVFNIGAGGAVGNGRQPMSWIGLEDAIGALHFLMINERAQGPINVVAPTATTNREFTHVLAKVLQRPALAPMPNIAIRALFGEMGDELMLKGQAAVPAQLTDLGFPWLEPSLDGALRWELGMPSEGQPAIG